MSRHRDVDITKIGHSTRSTYYRYGGSQILVSHHAAHDTYVCLTCRTANQCEHAKATRDAVEHDTWQEPAA